MVRGTPTALTCFFVDFRTYFVTSVRVSVASAGVLAVPARARNPQGGALPFRPPWLRPCPLGPGLGWSAVGAANVTAQAR